MLHQEFVNEELVFPDEEKQMLFAMNLVHFTVLAISHLVRSVYFWCHVWRLMSLGCSWALYQQKE